MKFCWIERSPVTVLRAVSETARYAYTVDWEPWEVPEQKVRLADIRVDLQKLEAVLG